MRGTGRSSAGVGWGWTVAVVMAISERGEGATTKRAQCISG